MLDNDELFSNAASPTSPLMFACKHKQCEIVELLLSTADIREYDAERALIKSCCHGATDCVARLLSTKRWREAIDVNQRDYLKGRSPLYFAAHFGRCDTAKLLLHYRADVNIQDEDGFTPLFIAALRG